MSQGVPRVQFGPANLQGRALGHTDPRILLGSHENSNKNTLFLFFSLCFFLFCLLVFVFASLLEQIGEAYHHLGWFRQDGRLHHLLKRGLHRRFFLKCFSRDARQECFFSRDARNVCVFSVATRDKCVCFLVATRDKCVFC